MRARASVAQGAPTHSEVAARLARVGDSGKRARSQVLRGVPLPGPAVK